MLIVQAFLLWGFPGGCAISRLDHGFQISFQIQILLDDGFQIPPGKAALAADWLQK